MANKKLIIQAGYRSNSFDPDYTGHIYRKGN